MQIICNLNQDLNVDYPDLFNHVFKYQLIVLNYYYA